MNRVIHEIDHGKRIVSGVEVTVNELIWTDGGSSFEVHRTDTDEDLTVDGCFDTPPTDRQITSLLDWAVHHQAGGSASSQDARPLGGPQ